MDQPPSASEPYEIRPTPSRVKDLPERLRPREEIDRLGVRNVSDDVLLAVLLRGGMPGRNVISIAQALITTYGSLTALAKASIDELMGIPGIGRVKAQIVVASLELARRMAEEALPEHPVVRTPTDAARVLRDTVRKLDTECMWLLLLDTKNRMTGPPITVSSGLLNASLVHPREVFRPAIQAASAGVVVVHNHPSGDPHPSQADISVTRQLVEAGRIVDIPVLDHVILAAPGGRQTNEFFSFRESGLVKFD